MPTEVEWAWAAGLFEGEGSIVVHRPTLRPGRTMLGREWLELRLAMTDEDVVRRFHQTVACGNVNVKPPKASHYQTQWQWQCTKEADVLTVLARFAPWLGARRSARMRDVLKILDERRPLVRKRKQLQIEEV